MQFLLGKEVEVVYSPNACQIGLKGTLIYEKNKKNGYVVLLTSKKEYKMIEKGILRVGEDTINIDYRYTKLKNSNLKLTQYERKA